RPGASGGRCPGPAAPGPARQSAPIPRNSPSVALPRGVHSHERGVHTRETVPGMSGTSLRDILRLPGGPVDLTARDPAATSRAPGGGHRTAAAATAAQGQRLAALQAALYAAGSTGTSTRRLLVVLQGMDTCGKDGTIEHVFGLLNPQGCQLTAFRAPNRQELAHHLLWRGPPQGPAARPPRDRHPRD